MGRDKLEKLRRELASDPNNLELRDQVYVEQARLEGVEIYLELLNDRETWNNSSVALQDDAIRAVSQKLELEFEWTETSLYQCADQSHRIAAFRQKKTDIIFHLIPGGYFRRGQSWQKPEKHLRIDVAPFLIGRFPVTQKEWQGVSEENDQFREANLPMNLVSWNDVQEWLGKVDGDIVLPSADQWEYAYRSGAQTEFYWGAEMDDDYCWHMEHTELSRAQEALAPELHFDSQKWNAFGLVDMAGNIWEMCEDAFYGLLDINQFDNKIMKGGSWKNPPRTCMADYRGIVNCIERYNNTGFRVAYSLDSIISTDAENPTEKLT